MTTQFGTIVYAPVVAGGDDLDDLPSAFGDQLGRTIHHFESEADKNTFTTTYLSRLYKSWAAVKQSDDTIVWYEWNGTQEDGSDGAWIELNGTSGGSFKVGQAYSPYTIVNNATEIETFWPLEVNQASSGSTQSAPNVASLSIKPDAYEPQHGISCLLKLDMVQTISGQQPHAIYMPEQVVATGMYFNLNPQERGVDVQDNTGGDTAATGGQVTEVLVKLAFLDTAPDNGTVNVWLEYKDPSVLVSEKILIDVNNNPLAVNKHINADSPIGDFIIAGAFRAKSTEPLKVMVETSWSINDKITLDPTNTMICINQFSRGYETSIARIEFLRRAALQITPAIQEFDNPMLSLAHEIKSINEPLATITANSGKNTLNEFGVQNLTPVSAQIVNDTFTIKDTGQIADYYVDTLLDNTHTRMLRGRDVVASIEIANPDNAFEFRAYQWTGKPDHVADVYSSRNNGSEIINGGWSLIKGIFIAEVVGDTFANHTLTFTVPESANNIIILVMPQRAESPSTLHLQDFTWGVSTPFTGYVEIERYNIHENHLRFDETYSEFFLTNQGYQSIRYTINNAPSTGQPMPVGVLAKGSAPIVIDNTKNVVSGSMDPQNDGVIKFTKDGEASISKSYQVWNEQGTDNTVTFWDVLFDIDGNESKIPGSEKTFTILKNTGAPGTTFTIPAYAIDVETGQSIGGRATSNKADGAYVQSQNISEYVVQTTIDFKELVATTSDITDLVNVGIPQALTTDRRVYTFTNNTDNNIEIPIDIPSDVDLAHVDVVGHSGAITTLIDTAEYAYNSNTKILTVHKGTTVTDGKIYMTFWS